MIIQCVIIDDEPLARECIANYIREIDFLKLVGEGNNPLQLIELMEHQEIDLIFLDIQMPVMNGIEFLKITNQRPSVILTTAFPNYALDGFELDVMDYLLKPITFNRFFKAVKKVWEFKQVQDASVNKTSRASDIDYFFVKNDKTYEKIYVKDILYVEAMQNYIAFHTVDCKRHLALITMKQAEENLQGNNFIRVHKSFIIAVDKIKSIADNKISIGSMQIPIGRNYKTQLMEIVQKNRF